MRDASRHKADLALLGAAFIWGITFVVVKDALADIGPFYFLALRYAAAFLFQPHPTRKQIYHISGPRFSLSDGAAIEAWGSEFYFQMT